MKDKLTYRANFKPNSIAQLNFLKLAKSQCTWVRNSTTQYFSGYTISGYRGHRVLICLLAEKTNVGYIQAHYLPLTLLYVHIMSDTFRHYYDLSKFVIYLHSLKQSLHISINLLKQRPLCFSVFTQ